MKNGGALPDMESPESHSPRRKRAVYVFAAAAVIFAAAMLFVVSKHSSWRSCTVTASVKTPVRENPADAFEAWWQALGSRAEWGSKGTPMHDDFKRNGDDWEWIYTEGRLVLVSIGNSVSRPDAYAVTGVNECSFGSATPR